MSKCTRYTVENKIINDTCYLLKKINPQHLTGKLEGFRYLITTFQPVLVWTTKI